MIDRFGRAITYLRLSVTDRCDLRCLYCMAEDMQFQPRRDMLSIEELQRLCAAFVRLGVRRIRITGGEPLVRRGVDTLVQGLGAMLGGGLDELTMTTNATRLAEFAPALAASGLRRINVSLDSLDSVTFRALTRHGDLSRVVDGILAAKAAGLKVKVNTVALKGVNDGEFDRLIAWCGEHGFDLCLIETMPVGAVGCDRAGHYLPLSAVRADLAGRWALSDLPDRTNGPARYVRIAETGGRLGFITPMSHTFCDGCNRMRVTCTGSMALCLGREDAVDLRGPLRGSEADGPLEAAILAGLDRKPKGHDFHIETPAVARHMSATGG
jgi:cyclic pyranopterin phosphate synthase